MAHNLMVDADGNARMAYVGDVPWHGLGAKVSQDMPMDEFLTVAGLNWNVDLIDMPKADGVAAISNRKMLVRPPLGDENESVCLDIVSNRFKPHQNMQIMEAFRDFIDAGNMTMETAGCLKNGEIVWGLAKTTQAFSVGNKEDVIQGYFLITNSHKRGQSLTAKMTPVRVVCNNTMTYALNSAAIAGTCEWRLRHNTDFTHDRLREMLETVGLVENQQQIMDEYQAQAEVLVNTRFSEQDNVRYLAEVFASKRESASGYWIENDRQLAVMIDGKPYCFDMPKTVAGIANLDTKELHGRNPLKKAAQIFDTQPGADMGEGSAWKAFNAVTYLLDHVTGSTIDSRMYSATMGRNVGIKDHAMQVGLRMAA